MAGSNLNAPQNSSVNVSLTDVNGYATMASCVGAPSGVATEAGVYQVGCIMQQTDAATGAVANWENTNTLASPTWTKIGTSAPGSISLASAHLLVGNASNVAADVALTGDIAVTNAGVSSIGATKVKGSMIATNAFIKFSGVGVNATGAPTNATVTGVANGDALIFALNMTDATDVTAKFAATANGANTISQLNTDLSAKTMLWLFLSRQ